MKILKNKKIFFPLVFGCLFFFSYSFVFAQNFELVDKQAYEEYYKKPLYVPDVRFSGEYQYNSLNFVDDNGDNRLSSWQEFKLRLQSEVNENIKLNLLFTNEPYEWGEDKEAYQSRQNTDRNLQNRQNIDVSLREFYLEYNSNPHAIFRMGRQPISLGDKLGLIYEGEADAFTLGCRIGTWCLEFGQANLGSSGTTGLESSGIATWLEFFYPVYESEETIKNYWIDNEKKERKHSRLDVDIYRIDDKQDRVAATNYGGRTYNPYRDGAGNTIYASDHYIDDNRLVDFITTTELTVSSDGSGFFSNSTSDVPDYVYFDREQETYGINFQWYAGNFGLQFNAIQNFGKKAYHYGGGDSNVVAGAERQTVGRLYRLEWEQLVGSSTQYGFVSLIATGGKTADSPSDDFPWSDNDGYFEWNKGTYGDALFYFGGEENYLGQAHSVNNLSYNSFYYKYHGADVNAGGITRLFTFSRNNAVYNEEGKKVSYIGWEWDLEIYKYFTDSLKFSFKGAYFKPGNAYSPNDSVRPIAAIPSSITMYNFQLEYTF